MSAETIRQWAQERVRTAEGGWTEAEDAMFCILCAMEDRAPHSWQFDSAKGEEYIALVLLAREYVNETRDIRAAIDLDYRLAGDFRHLPDWLKYCSNLPPEIREALGETRDI